MKIYQEYQSGNYDHLKSINQFFEMNHKQIEEKLKKADVSSIILVCIENDYIRRGQFVSRQVEQSKTPINEAKIFLNLHFQQIRSVEEWADKMGYSKSHFWRKFDACFDTSPQRVFIEKKKSVLVSFMRRGNDFRFKESAQEIHLPNGNSLHQFVKKHFGCTPTELKERVRTVKKR